MAQIYSTQFINSFENVGWVEYPVVGTQVAVLRHVTLTVRNPNSTLVVISVSQNAYIFQDTFPVAPTAHTIDWQGRMVFKAGDKISVFTGDKVDVVASGYLFSG